MKLKTIMHKAEERGYRAEITPIVGCVTRGESFEELLKKSMKHSKDVCPLILRNAE